MSAIAHGGMGMDTWWPRAALAKASRLLNSFCSNVRCSLSVLAFSLLIVWRHPSIASAESRLGAPLAARFLGNAPALCDLCRDATLCGLCIAMWTAPG